MAVNVLLTAIKVCFSSQPFYLVPLYRGIITASMVLSFVQEGLNETDRMCAFA